MRSDCPECIAESGRRWRFGLVALVCAAAAVALLYYGAWIGRCREESGGLSPTCVDREPARADDSPRDHCTDITYAAERAACQAEDQRFERAWIERSQRRTPALTAGAGLLGVALVTLATGSRSRRRRAPSEVSGSPYRGHGDDARWCARHRAGA